jgi:hypothetical protein
MPDKWEYLWYAAWDLPFHMLPLSIVNPPVHAWATLFLHRTELALRGEVDLDFLKSAFNKLLLNFTWWVNRKDRFGKNVFEGGFLGLDNIGVFDRSATRLKKRSMVELLSLCATTVIEKWQREGICEKGLALQRTILPDDSRGGALFPPPGKNSRHNQDFL